MGTVPIPVSVLTSRLAAPVVLANIATSIPYRQYCFAHHSCLTNMEADEAQSSGLVGDELSNLLGNELAPAASRLGLRAPGDRRVRGFPGRNPWVK